MLGPSTRELASQKRSTPAMRLTDLSVFAPALTLRSENPNNAPSNLCGEERMDTSWEKVTKYLE